jgi:ankyrin repeat protein
MAKVAAFLERYGDSYVDVKTAKEGNTALMLAAWAGRLEIVQLLLKHGASVQATNNTGTTALKRVVVRGEFPDILETLLAHGASPDERWEDPVRRTPLMHAVHYGYPEIVQLLVAHGAPLDAKNEEGVTAQDLAERGELPEHFEIVAMLKQAAAQKAAEKAEQAEQERQRAVTAAVAGIYAGISEEISVTPLKFKKKAQKLAP